MIITGTNPTIWDAAQSGNIEVVGKLLDSGTDVNAERKFDFTGPVLRCDGQYQETPLICSIAGKKLECMEYLIKRGADVHKPTYCRNVPGYSLPTLEKDRTPLEWAIEKVSAQMVKLLLDNKTDPNFTYCTCFTPLALVKLRLGYKPEPAKKLELEAIAKLLVAHGGRETISS